MKEIAVTDLFLYIKKKWLVLIIIFIILFSASFMYFKMNQRKSYSYSKSVLIINKKLGDDTNYISTIKNLLKTKNNVNEAIEKINNNKIKYDDIINDLQIVQLDDSDILSLTFSLEQKNDVSIFLNSLIDTTTNYVEELYDNIELKVVDESDVVEIVVAKSNKEIILLSFTIAIILDGLFGMCLFIFKEIKNER